MAEVSFVPNHIPPPACYPPDYNALLDELTTGGGISGTVPDNAGGGIFVGSSPPGSSLTNKVWYKVDGAARPLGVYMFYNGNWRKVYTGAAIGEIRMFWYYSGLIDGSGRGNVGGDMDGWQLCNGQNGAPNLEAYTPVCGQQGETVGQAAGQWFTDADGAAWRNTGGQKARTVLSVGNLPSAMVARTYITTLQNGTGATKAVVTNDGTQPFYDITIKDEGTGAPPSSTPLPYQNLYFAVGFFMYIGYA